MFLGCLIHHLSDNCQVLLNRLDPDSQCIGDLRRVAPSAGPYSQYVPDRARIESAIDLFNNRRNGSLKVFLRSSRDRQVCTRNL